MATMIGVVCFFMDRAAGSSDYPVDSFVRCPIVAVTEISSSTVPVRGWLADLVAG